MSLRVVFDTGTLVSAAIRPDSLPDRALNIALMFHLVFTSADALDELQRVLSHAKFDRYTSKNSRALFFEKFKRDVFEIKVLEAARAAAHGACRDRNDEPFLALCLEARATVLVSSDLDLRTLNPWRGTDILTAAQFLSRCS